MHREKVFELFEQRMSRTGKIAKLMYDLGRITISPKDLDSICSMREKNAALLGNILEQNSKWTFELFYYCIVLYEPNLLFMLDLLKKLENVKKDDISTHSSKCYESVRGSIKEKYGRLLKKLSTATQIVQIMYDAMDT